MILNYDISGKALVAKPIFPTSVSNTCQQGEQISAERMQITISTMKKKDTE